MVGRSKLYPLEQEMLLLLNSLEKHYGTQIEYMFPGDVEVQALVSNVTASVNGTSMVVDIFKSENVLSLGRQGFESLMKLENRRKGAWNVVLYAPWCPFCQPMEASFDESVGERWL
ncbi:hypothetical protein YC2023_042914 [Brassica napus]|uniref:(rape) hypothetical protein n=1 Tax=Brassica napus TaxID=3708 RepID=A0A816IML5_BRANA|nr:unnamed protein product [Brassica napus]